MIVSSVGVEGQLRHQFDLVVPPLVVLTPLDQATLHWYIFVRREFLLVFVWEEFESSSLPSAVDQTDFPGN